MRIIAGRFKGRKLNPPLTKWPTRPTTDFAREALFNVLSNRFEFDDISLLDLFGGTGSVSLEAVSRSCSNVVYVEKHRACVRWVQDWIKKLDIQDQLSCISTDVKSYIQQTEDRFDLIFADPPYDQKKWTDLPIWIFERNLLKPGGLLIIEHSQFTDFSHIPQFLEKRRYGQSCFSYFEEQA